MHACEAKHTCGVRVTAAKEKAPAGAHRRQKGKGIVRKGCHALSCIATPLNTTLPVEERDGSRQADAMRVAFGLWKVVDVRMQAPLQVCRRLP